MANDSKPLEALLKRTQARLSEGAYPNEAAISINVVMPILAELGWDVSDPSQIMPEYAKAGRRVDFALCASGKRPAIFIEVKGLGRATEGDRQLFEYAFHEGIPLCLLTDGREWSFYLPGGQGAYDERRVYRLHLTERPIAECVRVLDRYLDRSRVRSGAAFEDAMRDYRDIASRREAARSIPAAWSQLVSQPEDLLIDLLGERTEAIAGYRPTNVELQAFLRSLQVDNRLPAANKLPADVAGQQEHSTKKSLPSTVTALHAPIDERSDRRGVTFTFFGNEHHVSSAATALVEILRMLASRYPESLPAVAEAARSRKRNHIARTPEEIYPLRPDLARAVEFAPGWLVGLNISNRDKMRLIREACAVTGAKLGADVKIDLPNSDG
ncbi:MAG: hypothetical protein JNK46_10925 [Methylobacteriaceae bacterium]|nr:hypothetical protein [Methylobacteriaceae bacterium]